MNEIDVGRYSLDRTLAFFNAKTMEEHLRCALFLPHLAGSLFGVVGFAGPLLAGSACMA